MLCNFSNLKIIIIVLMYTNSGSKRNVLKNKTLN